MRKQVYLNGEWDFMPDFEGRSPQKAINNCIWEKEKIRVPSSWKWKINRTNGYEPYNMFLYPEHWNDAVSGVLGRAFDARPEPNQRVFLIFKGVLQNWQVFVNDIRVLESQEAFLPVEIDITDFIHGEGENSLKVWCGPFKTVETPFGKKQVGLTGSWFAQDSMGIWQDVILEYRHNAYLLTPFVRTSYKERLIEAEIDVCGFEAEHNAPGLESQAETVHFSILEDGQAIKTFEGYLQRKENGFSFFKGSLQWDDAVLWMPDHPHLYILRAELRAGGNPDNAADDSLGGKPDNTVVDTLETSFGFREVWAEANKFYMNGIRINLRGDSWHYQGFVYQTKEYAMNWYKLCKDSGMNFVRLHAMPYPDFFLDAADEAGMLIIDESAIYGSCKKMQADDEEFISNCQNHLGKLVARDRNHPSVIMWSMQNEMRWVNGRDVYKLHMKHLIAAIRALDPTRPVSFDGDNRLVDQDDMEVVSMHYNIDGTIAGWDKSKPLAFGEHGKWHYVAPHVACGLVGGKAYESMNSCLLNMAKEEALFIEYARKEDVTAICPFNTCYYMMDPMPAEDLPLSWSSLEGPGAKPRVVRKYSMTINNGLLKDYPVYTPNISYKLVSDAFHPITIIPDEYDSSFFDGRPLERNFSVYNDSYSAHHVVLNYRMKGASGNVMQDGSVCFEQFPGERRNIRLEFSFPKSESPRGMPFPALFTLELDLIHDGVPVYSLYKQYKVYSYSSILHSKTPGKKILYIGEVPDYEILKDFTGAILHRGEVTEQSLNGTDLLILGRNSRGLIKVIQPVLNRFVSSGGFLLIMEQDREAPGELVLSGKSFAHATMACPDHPVFEGLTKEDFAHWNAENINVPDGYRPVANAFEKPVNGDLKVLLECGDGDFGCGGLCWAAMLEYRIGEGRVILQQFDITGKFFLLPQARLLLRNILDYASEVQKSRYARTGLFSKNMPHDFAYDFFIKAGLDFMDLTHDFEKLGGEIIIAEPDAITCRDVLRLKTFVENGGKLVLLPLDNVTVCMAEIIAGCRIEWIKHAVYQVLSVHPELGEGITPYDSYHFEKVTYTPSNKSNHIIAESAVNMNGLERVLVNIATPWEDLFVNDLADEKIKQATIQMAKSQSFKELCYCGYLPHGKGGILFCQLDLKQENDKIQRIYSRLLANMGAEIKTNLLTYVKEEKDFSIGTFMMLPYEKYNDYAAEEAYFSSASYVLNNLGEGVYGWMTRVEKKNGFISIKDSAGKTCFLTLFIASEINRDPQMRKDGELPDSSIVPDLLLTANCGVKLFINGRKIFERSNSDDLEEFHVEDIVLDKGINRFAAVCVGGRKDILFNACFLDKRGEFIKDLKYNVTLD